MAYHPGVGVVSLATGTLTLLEFIHPNNTNRFQTQNKAICILP